MLFRHSWISSLLALAQSQILLLKGGGDGIDILTLP